MLRLALASLMLGLGGCGGDGPAQPPTGAAPLRITTSTLPIAIVGEDYHAVVGATGGVGRVTWSLVAGALPMGLTLDHESGVVRGVPTLAGGFPLTLSAVSGGTGGDAKAFTLTVDVGPSGGGAVDPITGTAVALRQGSFTDGSLGLSLVVGGDSDPEHVGLGVSAITLTLDPSSVVEWTPGPAMDLTLPLSSPPAPGLEPFVRVRFTALPDETFWAEGNYSESDRSISFTLSGAGLAELGASLGPGPQEVEMLAEGVAFSSGHSSVGDVRDANDAERGGPAEVHGLYPCFNANYHNEIYPLDPVPGSRAAVEGDVAIVLVHGWNSNGTGCTAFQRAHNAGKLPGAASFRTLIESFLVPTYGPSGQDRPIYAFTYPSDRPVAVSGAHLAEEVAELVGDQNAPLSGVVIIGYSMGGLVGRYAASEVGVPRLMGLITLGTPHDGTPYPCLKGSTEAICDGQHISFVDLTIALGIRTDGGQDLINPSRYILSPMPVPLIAYTGDISERSDPFYLSKYRIARNAMCDDWPHFCRNDGVVPTASAAFPGATDVRRLDYSHGELKNGWLELGAVDDVLFSALRADLAVLMDRFPTASIATPAAGAAFGLGEPVDFQGSGTDPDGLPITGNALVWTSDRDGLIGTGSHLVSGVLTLGAHTITLSAFDERGVFGKATVGIVVAQPSVPEVVAVGANADLSGPGTLWRVPLSMAGQDVLVGEMSDPFGNFPVMYDVARSPDGSVWGISPDPQGDLLWLIDEPTAAVTLFGQLPGVTGSNAMVFGVDGDLFVGVSDGRFVEVDLVAGLFRTIGTFGNGFGANGDLAFSDEGVLYGTLNTLFGTPRLATIDPTTGSATVLGAIGVTNVFGLVFDGSTLYGLTSSATGDRGRLIRLDLATGQGVVVRDLAFNAFGADRPVALGNAIGENALDRESERLWLPVVIFGGGSPE